MSELTVDASIPRYPPCDELERKRIELARAMKARRVHILTGGGNYPQRPPRES